MAFKFAFLIRQVKVPSPEKSGHIVAHENVHFSYGNYETWSSNFANENAKCLMVFENYSYSYYSYHASQPLAARFRELAFEVAKTRLLLLVLLRAQERISEQPFQLMTSGVSDDTKCRGSLR